MITLPPFSGDEPTCAKCGYVGASTEYLPMGDCVHGPRDRGVTLGRTANERLHRECQRCQYQWDEAVVTAHEPTNRPEQFASQCKAITDSGLLRARCIMPTRHASHHADGSGLRWTDSVAQYPEETR